MNIDTTINITNKNLKLIMRIAKEKKIKRNEFIIQLIKLYIKKRCGKYKNFIRVCNQKKDRHEQWKSIHLWIKPDFYEKCCDLRKFHKFSLSFIVAQALKMYQMNQENFTDNYQSNYIFLFTQTGNSHIFITTWEYPEEKVLEKLYNIYNKHKN